MHQVRSHSAIMHIPAERSAVERDCTLKDVEYRLFISFGGRFGGRTKKAYRIDVLGLPQIISMKDVQQWKETTSPNGSKENSSLIKSHWLIHGSLKWMAIHLDMHWIHIQWNKAFDNSSENASSVLCTAVMYNVMHLCHVISLCT